MIQSQYVQVKTDYYKVARNIAFLCCFFVPLLVGSLQIFAEKNYPEEIAEPGLLQTDQFRVTAIYPHNQNCFTEGLQFNSQGVLYQSCGPIPSGESFVQEYSKMESGEPQFRSKTSFYEGLTFYQGKMILLTYKEGFLFQFKGESAQDIAQKVKVPELTQMWGAAANSTHLFISNGSRFINVFSSNFQSAGVIEVKKGGVPWAQTINQLEWDHAAGVIYANNWFSNTVIAFDLHGSVVRELNLAILAEHDKEVGSSHSPQKCLNGIAISGGKMLVTGKLYRQIYQLQLF